MASDPSSGPSRLAPLVAAMYDQANPQQRLRLLNALLRPLGPMALVTVAAGAFAGLLPDDRWREAEASLEDTKRVSVTQVLALADYVAQKSPQTLDLATLTVRIASPQPGPASDDS
jgi:hypothetical protein